VPRAEDFRRGDRVRSLHMIGGKPSPCFPPGTLGTVTGTDSTYGFTLVKVLSDEWLKYWNTDDEYMFEDGLLPRDFERVHDDL
jgi:hypothetical protein